MECSKPWPLGQVRTIVLVGEVLSKHQRVDQSIEEKSYKSHGVIGILL
jgi:hypothetical protein